MGEGEGKEEKLKELEEKGEGEGGGERTTVENGEADKKIYKFVSLLLAGHSIISSSPLSVIL